MKFVPVASVPAHRLLRLSLATVTVMGGSIFFVPSSQALTATTEFVCAKFEGKPATVARTKKGDVPIVVWNSEEFSASGFTPLVRCKQVSARFQTLYRSGQLKYITAGTLNKLPAICATPQMGGACSRQNLLYTLKPTQDPQQVIKKLMMVRNRATSSVLEESAAPPTTNDLNSIELNWLDEN